MTQQNQKTHRIHASAVMGPDGAPFSHHVSREIGDLLEQGTPESLQKARALSEKFYNLYQDDAVFVGQYANILRCLGEADKAEVQFLKIINDINQYDLYALNSLVLLLLDRRDNKDATYFANRFMAAAENFDEYAPSERIKLNANEAFIRGYGLLAQCALAEGATEEARKYLEQQKAKTDGEYQIPALGMLTRCALAEGNSAETRVYLAQIKAKTGGEYQIPALGMLVKSYLLEKNFDKANEIIGELATKAGSNKIMDSIYRAQIQIGRGKPADALIELRSVLERQESAAALGILRLMAEHGVDRAGYRQMIGAVFFGDPKKLAKWQIDANAPMKDPAGLFSAVIKDTTIEAPTSGTFLNRVFNGEGYSPVDTAAAYAAHAPRGMIPAKGK